MVMNMGRDAEQGVVELEYVQQREEMTEAIRLMLRKRGRAAGLVYHPVFAGCAILIGAALVALGFRNGDAGNVFGIMLIVWGLLIPFAPRSMADKMVAANRHHGLTRVTVTDEGVHMVSAHADLRTDWANYGSYAEGPGVFVLRSPDQAGNCAMVLVKKGVRTPADVDRLRTVLDRNLTRV
ncbi:hypothetical protein DI272_33595 [Streptomyces sp. Act143]|uniref:hypothetical protein n=1 Tax=Streptomyces sp. Act143 TaxID=2200760 RepID=UPI000D685007|nr:hypothetical protein [Streptomyces sp. Act143]PWI18529.1 hypothetical protein DI272_33595 [Streptomyces sp. Act143]